VPASRLDLLNDSFGLDGVAGVVHDHGKTVVREP
jgi:hypothetical protein